ncbi:MAG: DUF1540 domain-containing protein [Defluviitaleaceae bacterium]|nr:DUF1540 domain-containing protein [Defluviitaleaceae bacterium]
MSNQTIKCRVSNCKYNDAKSICSLGNITVGNCGQAAHAKAETECESFECK